MSDQTAVPLEELDFYAHYADPFWWGYVRHGDRNLCYTDGHLTPVHVVAELHDTLKELGFVS